MLGVKRGGAAKAWYALLALGLLAGSAGACAKEIGAPVPLAIKVRPAGDYPALVSEAELLRVQELSLSEVRALSEQGRQDARIQLARLLWLSGDANAPIPLLEEPAKAGVPVAQYLLGTYLRYRNRDPERGLKLIAEAANQGHPIAQESLAWFYETGRHGLPLDIEKAFDLYLQAAQQGLAHSQMNVGMMLCAGRGVAQDKALGAAWFVSSQQGQRAPLSAKQGGCE